MQDLDTLGGNNSAAYGINASGWVVGWADTTSENAVAFVYNGTTVISGTLGGSQSEAVGINDAGQVVGTSETSNDASDDGFLYDNGSFRDLSTLPEVVAAGWSGIAPAAINDSGEIVGEGINSAGDEQAFLSHPQSMSRYLSTIDSTTLYNLGCAQNNQ